MFQRNAQRRMVFLVETNALIPSYLEQFNVESVEKASLNPIDGVIRQEIPNAGEVPSHDQDEGA